MTRVALVLMVYSLIGTPYASAQSFAVDARVIGMGGESKDANIAVSMVESFDSYLVIPVPLGLFQVLGDLDAFNPTSDEFDPVWAIESASNPLHYTFGRKRPSSDGPQQRFIRDLINGRMSRDLATYSGWRLPATASAEGLASPAFGGTIKFARRDSGAFQGIFIGAGPYLSYQTSATFDERLVDIFESGSRYGNSSLLVGNESGIQLALSIVVGYRARFELPGASSERDGIYLAGNYRHLRGFKYLQPDVSIRFDTDSQGLVALAPTTTPFDIIDLESSSGTGRAVDVGVQVVRDRWEFGAGVNGIGNQIEWTDLTLKRFTMTSLLNGGDFVEQEGPAPVDSVTVELPVVTTGNIAYEADRYAFRASMLHGFNGNSFNGGGERRFGPLAVRAGARYSRGRWEPTYGFGIGRRVALDVGFYGTHANLQEERQTSMAISIRVGRNN